MKIEIGTNVQTILGLFAVVILVLYFVFRVIGTSEAINRLSRNQVFFLIFFFLVSLFGLIFYFLHFDKGSNTINTTTKDVVDTIKTDSETTFLDTIKTIEYKPDSGPIQTKIKSSKTVSIFTNSEMIGGDLILLYEDSTKEIFKNTAGTGKFKFPDPEKIESVIIENTGERWIHYYLNSDVIYFSSQNIVVNE